MSNSKSLRKVGDFYLPVECSQLDYMKKGSYCGYAHKGLSKSIILDNGDGVPLEFRVEEEKGYCFIEIEMCKYFVWIKGDMKSIRFLDSKRIGANLIRKAKIDSVLKDSD